MRKFKFLLTELKSAFKYYILGLSVLTALFVLSFVCLIAVYMGRGNGGNSGLMEIAVVNGDEGVSAVDLIGLAEGIEGVSSLCRMTQMDEESAMEALTDGAVSLVMEIPQNFYADASSFKDTSIKVYVNGTPTAAEKKLLAMISGAEDLVDITDDAIMAMYSGLEVYDIPVSRMQMESDLFLRTISEFSEREDSFRMKVLSVYGDYDILQFYYASLLTAVIMISGVFYFGMYRHGFLQLEKMIFRGGLSGLWASACRIIVMTVITSGMASLLAAAAGAVLEKAGFGGYVPGVRAFACIWLTGLSAALWVHLLASVSGDSAHSRSLYVLLVLLALTAGGVIIPAVYLPDILKNISAYLPGGSYHGLLMDGIWGRRRLDGTGAVIAADVPVCIASFILYGRRMAGHD